MFDFLFQNKKGELKSISDMISIEIKKMKITNMAIEKAVRYDCTCNCKK